MARMKILIITQFFPPDLTAAAFRLGDFAELFADRGHEVVVLAGSPHKAQVPGNAVDLDRKFKVELCQVAPLSGVGSRAYIKHYMSYVWSSLLKSLKLCWSGWKPDVIYASSPPLFVGFTAIFSKLMYRKPLVFEVRDIWPDSAVAAGQLRLDSRAYKIGKRLERFFYNRANRITCVAKPMREYIETQTKNPVSVVYNGVAFSDLSRFQEFPSTNSGELNRPKVLVYAGNFGRVQNLNLLIEAFAEFRLEQDSTNWILKLIGDGAKRKELEDQICKLGVGNFIKITGPLSRDECNCEMLAADALFFSLLPSSVLEHTIPSKLFDYLAASKPIIGGINGEGVEILNQSGGNLVFEPGSLTSLKHSLVELDANLEEMSKRALFNREIVKASFTREAAVDSLLRSFESLISNA
jgi:glycosyltransferase involved in cell wall biosynthesis